MFLMCPRLGSDKKNLFHATCDMKPVSSRLAIKEPARLLRFGSHYDDSEACVTGHPSKSVVVDLNLLDA